MTCVTITRFSVKVNEGGYKYFEGKRGLQQRDLMSFLLFILVMEYLTKILEKLSEIG